MGKDFKSSMSGKKILLFERNAEEQQSATALFESQHHQVTPVMDRDALFKELSCSRYDLVLLGAVSPLASSIALLGKIKIRYPELPVVVAASGVKPKEAVAAMKSGAMDFFTKPLDGEMLENINWPAIDNSRAAAPSLDEKFRIITRDASMEKLLDAAVKVSRSRASVLIQGESGTGKELIARYIHARSQRHDKPFVAINCAALPVTLLESELFGHEKGTFTGALGRKKGKFELADGGTLLLDEISEMEPVLQAKLLRVLQEREIDRVGGAAPVAVDVRILATTNRDLLKMIDDGGFREDLFYRLNVIPLQLPTLRERLNDIPLLADHFIQKYNRIDGKSVKGLTPASLDLLMNRSWKGNVRELENVIERAVLMCDGTHIEAEDFTATPGQTYGTPTLHSFSPTVSLREMEEKIILQALDHTNDNRTHAAKILGISVRTLRNKLNEYKEKMTIQ